MDMDFANLTHANLYCQVFVNRGLLLTSSSSTGYVELAFADGAERSADPSEDSKSQGGLPGVVHFRLVFSILYPLCFYPKPVLWLRNSLEPIPLSLLAERHPPSPNALSHPGQ